MRKILFAALVALVAASCTRYVPVTVKRDSIQKLVVREYIHDTAIQIVSDSSAIQYLVDCEDDRAQLRQIMAVQMGKHALPPRVIIKDKVLYVECRVDSFAVYAIFKSRDTTNYIRTSSEVVMVKEPPWWHKWPYLIILLILIACAAYGTKKIIKR